MPTFIFSLSTISNFYSFFFSSQKQQQRTKKDHKLKKNRYQEQTDQKEQKSRIHNPLIEKRYHEGRTTKHCSRHHLFVSFDELKLEDLVIAPVGYESFHCAGSCKFPIPTHIEQTNHAIMQLLAHVIDPKNAAEPCCAPTKYSAISVLYVRKKTVYHVKKFQQMIADKCACQ